jgi:predicted transposase YdaD
MPKTADIGSKRLISLAPDTWARWLTGDPAVDVLDFPSGEFQWLGRATDVLMKVKSPRHGTFLIVNEIQFRPDSRMSLRLRVYAALGEERYGLNVYPVVVNILPLSPGDAVVTSYHSEFMGLVAHQDYRVFNLWEVDAGQVLEQSWMTLLPFVPVLKGGDDEVTIGKALALLRADDQVAEMEPLLAFFATFVLTPDEVRRMMRWNMAMLRESPWYNEIEKEGLERGLRLGLEQGLEQGIEQGIEQGQTEMLLRVLDRRFGPLPAELVARIHTLRSQQLAQLLDVILDAAALDEVTSTVEALSTSASLGSPSPA